MEKTNYYQNELTDDFAGMNIKKKPVTDDFQYVHRSPLWNVAAFILYRFIAYPLLIPLSGIWCRIRVRGKKNIDKIRGNNYFLYGNHTQIADAFIINRITMPSHKCYVITDGVTVSIPFLKNIVQMLGAIPLPDQVGGMKNFLQTIATRLKQGGCIAIFPEAHIWPYYTKIRPFTEASFRYPVMMEKPVVAFCTTYTRAYRLGRELKRPKITVYVSEPFYPDTTLKQKDAAKKLRNQVYEFMTETAEKYSDYEYVHYEKREQ